MSFEEEYADVLQNIEFAIVTVYRRNNALLDYDVTSALETLIRIYRGEQTGRPAGDNAELGRKAPTGIRSGAGALRVPARGRRSRGTRG